jgi:hypothetical protein
VRHRLVRKAIDAYTNRKPGLKALFWVFYIIIR